MGFTHLLALKTKTVYNGNFNKTKNAYYCTDYCKVAFIAKTNRASHACPAF